MFNATDNSDRTVELLEQIAESVSGGLQVDQDVSVERNIEQQMGQGGGAMFVAPRNAVIVANETWTDDTYEDITLSDLGPGESAVVASVETTAAEEALFVAGVGATTHTADPDGDGTHESIVNYRFETKLSRSSSWTTNDGLQSAVPTGSMTHPEPLVPAGYYGPVVGFRLKIENTSGSETIAADQYGGRISAIAVRGESQ